MKNELTVLGLNYETLGKSLVQQAQEQEREQANKVAVANVQAILRDITVQQSVIARATQRIEIQERRIKALDHGKFLVKNEGGSPFIVFSEDDLNGSL